LEKKEERLIETLTTAAVIFVSVGHRSRRRRRAEAGLT
jgi:hypothetical protein